MWKKRNEETTPPASSPRTGSAGIQPEGATSPRPPITPARVPRAVATIGKAVQIKGQIYSEEDLRLDGQVEGTIELPGNSLIIGTSGKVQATIKAREVDVLGTVHGDIVAGDKITIRKAANLVGDLKSATISIEDGAYFKGSIDIVRPAAPTKAVIAPSPSRTAPAGTPPQQQRLAGANTPPSAQQAQGPKK